MQKDANILWNECTQILRDNLTPSVYNTWFAPLEVVDWNNDVLVLRVKSEFVVEYIEENYIHLLSRCIRRTFGEKTRLEYRVLVDSTSGTATTYPSENAANQSTDQQRLSFATEKWDTQLNNSYTFSTFVQGETNKLARTAGVAISKNPGKTVFNPLFIWGGSGVGKTHLANAIGNHIAQHIPGARVLYVSANTFKLQYQEAAYRNKIPEFLQFYQSVDVLILDDIQFFANLKGTQDTFFHIFNFLHQSRKQLILTSDRSPLQLKDVEDRLLTRFKWGLSVEILRPDFELRKSILKDKVHRDGLELSEEIIDYIAANACENVRDIEGILASLMAYSTLMNTEINMDLAKSVVSRLVSVTPREVLLEDVVGMVCEHTNVTEKAITSKSRQKDVLRARQMIVYLAKQLTGHSLNEIGQVIGNRSHATVLHAFTMVKDQMEYDKVLKHDIQLLEGELRR